MIQNDRELEIVIRRARRHAMLLPRQRVLLSDSDRAEISQCLTELADFASAARPKPTTEAAR